LLKKIKFNIKRKQPQQIRLQEHKHIRSLTFFKLKVRKTKNKMNYFYELNKNKKMPKERVT